MTDNDNINMSDYLDKIETDNKMSVETHFNLNGKLRIHPLEEIINKIDLTVLRELDISNNNLQELPASFSLLTKLEHLKMDNNKFKTLPIVIAGNRHLKSLSCSNNQLEIISEELGSLNNLEILNLSFNNLSKFPKTFAKLNRLREFNFAGNKFEIIPQCITDGMRNLEILDLSLNKCIKLNVPPCSRRLKKFYAMNNSICRTFPRWLLTSAYSSIEEVNFNETEFLKFSFPKERANLNLRVFNFNQSVLTDNLFEMLTKDMHRLEKIDIGNDSLRSKDGNTFCNVPCQNFKNPQTIKEIDMKCTGLPMVSRLINNLTNITIIDLSHNNIAWLPDEFCLLMKLEVLIINDNSLSLLPDNFGNLVGLKELIVYRNKLSSLPASMSNLKELRLLDVYDNSLQEVPWHAVNLEHLQAIDIDVNYFSTDNLTIRNMSYEIFRKSVRGRCVSFAKRSDEAKILQEEVDEAVGEYPAAAYSGSSNSSCDNDSDHISTQNSLVHNDEENWDLSEDSTDDYEPTFTSRRKYRASIPTNFHGQFFCPDDLHVPPVRQQVRQIFNDRRMSRPPIEEGQFDDA